MSGRTFRVGYSRSVIPVGTICFMTEMSLSASVLLRILTPAACAGKERREYDHPGRLFRLKTGAVVGEGLRGGSAGDPSLTLASLVRGCPTITFRQVALKILAIVKDVGHLNHAVFAAAVEKDVSRLLNARAA